MKIVKKLILTSILITACFAFTNTVLASDDNITNPYITINKPTVKKVYYKGENINYSVYAQNPWSNYWAHPWIGLVKNSNSNIVATKEFQTIGVGGTLLMNGVFKTSGLSTGSYAFAAILVPTETVYPYNVANIDTKKAAKLIYIKTLKAPKKVKATAKKKGIRVTYNKALGATKYEIYRSRKKSSGYKKIITTTKVSYLDKKAKKGKKYYYKVRSVRTVNNTIKSKFSAKANTRRK